MRQIEKLNWPLKALCRERIKLCRSLAECRITFSTKHKQGDDDFIGAYKNCLSFSSNTGVQLKLSLESKFNQQIGTQRVVVLSFIRRSTL